MALDPQPTPTTTTTPTATTTTTTTRPLTNINTNTSPAQPARPVYVQNPHPHHHHHHQQIPHLYPQVRSPNPTQQGILYPVASSGRGFIPKPPLQNSVTVATNNNVTTTTTTTATSSVGVGYPTRPLVSYPQVHVMRPPLHHLHQQHPTSQLPSATNPIKGIPISTHQKVAPPTSVSDYNGYKDPRDKSMDAFSRGKTVDESLYTIRDRKVSIWFFFWLIGCIYASLACFCFQGDKSVEDLSPKDLLKRHVKHAKKVRARLREERLRRIARYKSRLALLLPPLVEQFRNDTAARN
ncbi:uncharacterized protein LOC111988573 [Quercus suber]|uniref:uncharacterized protein LOC111988573 n=1 Tax=Quercus suber TaxID=58331 RepID=UPI0032E02F27